MSVLLLKLTMQRQLLRNEDLAFWKLTCTLVFQIFLATTKTQNSIVG